MSLQNVRCLEASAATCVRLIGTWNFAVFTDLGVYAIVLAVSVMRDRCILAQGYNEHSL